MRAIPHKLGFGYKIEETIRTEIAGNCIIELGEQKAISTFINLLADSKIEYSIRIQLAKSLGNNQQIQLSQTQLQEHHLFLK